MQAGQPYARFGFADVGSDSSRATNALAAREGLVLLTNPPMLSAAIAASAATSASVTAAAGALPAALARMLPFAQGQGGHTVVIGFAANDTWPIVGSYVEQFCPDGSGDCFPSILAAIAGMYCLYNSRLLLCIVTETPINPHPPTFPAQPSASRWPFHLAATPLRTAQVPK